MKEVAKIEYFYYLHFFFTYSLDDISVNIFWCNLWRI